MLDTGDGQAMALPVDDEWDVASSVMPAPLPEPPPQPASARCQLVYASEATKAAVNCYFESDVDTVGICV
ncbi:hypothetical protein NP493_3068g00003 [Ridgeia piscesae]|uniref:Uncharacterized protein n=1 Tax=Ridgeia piscesae TaxID=27915 RepID=A0AAD9JAB0_RIDPI|nr:hypothetical protein NP493_3068g00003 [Ridgeia piscesae]